MTRLTVRRWLMLIGLCLLAASACDRQPSPATAVANHPASAATLNEVCEATSELLGVERTKIQPSTSLADLGADELDFVELVMELEERFDISIPDDEAEQMMGTSDWQAGMKNVTMQRLAALVEVQKE